MVFNGVAYAYVKNLQGDIIAILDSTGAVVVNYTYDAWGMPTSIGGTLATSLGVLNPFRYRGYVYDEETGLYYLRSRYYFPNSCRFLNCDDAIGQKRIHSHNLFAYCRNKVVKVYDADGREEKEISLADMGADYIWFVKGQYYRIGLLEEGVKATCAETNTKIKVYTMLDDNGNAIDYCARYNGKRFEFYYGDQLVSLGLSEIRYKDSGDEWAFYLGYNTETVVHDSHRPRATTRHTQIALSYATGIFIECDGTFCKESWNATMAFQKQLVKRDVEIAVDGWAGKDTKPWLLPPLLDALYDMETNLPP